MIIEGVKFLESVQVFDVKIHHKGSHNDFFTSLSYVRVTQKVQKKKVHPVLEAYSPKEE